MLRPADPLYLLLLGPALLAAVVLLRRRNVRTMPFSAVRRLPGRSGTWRSRAAESAPFLFLAGILLSVLALARPQAVTRQQRRTVDAIAIQMVVDVSGSMSARLLPAGSTQLSPEAKTRLEAVKDAFSGFVARRPADLIGLVTFSGYATAPVPLTLDHETVLTSLQAVDTAHGPAGGPGGSLPEQEELLTAIGDGLALACARLRDAEPRTRIAVLLSDGRESPGIGCVSLAQAVGIARRLGIKVYTLGVGTDKDGLDEKALQRIAEATGGRYVAVANRQALEQALREIDRHEKTPVKQEDTVSTSEHFAPFLGTALLLVAVAVSLNTVIRGCVL